MNYNKIYFSKDDLIESLKGHLSGIQINRIISAYELADQAYANEYTEEGIPVFFHTSRVCKIIIKELNILNPDLIISSLLHYIYRLNDEISNIIIDLNFGPYVAYLLEILKLDVLEIKYSSEELNFYDKLPKDDYLIIWLAEHLDYFRSISLPATPNAVEYINKISAEIIPLIENTNNKVNYLINEIKKERNKLIG